MIKKEEINELVGFYHQHCWMLNIVFLVYFAFSLHHIGHMKSETILIQDELKKEVLVSKKMIKDNYESNYEFNALRSYNKKFYDSMYQPLSDIQNLEDVDPVQWLTHFNDIKSHMYKISDYGYMNLDVKPYLLKFAIKHPALRPYIAQVYASEIMNHLLLNSFPGGTSTIFCSWMYPVIQKIDDNYLLYPKRFESCLTTYSQFKINGTPIENNNYIFQPDRKGIHNLDIEYSYLIESQKGKILFRKELIVE